MNFGVEATWIAEISSFLIFAPIMFKRFYSEKWLDIQIYENSSKIS